MRFTFPSIAIFLLFFSTIGLSIGAGNDTEAKSQGVVTCTTLQSALGADIVVSSGPQYTAGASGAWNFFNTKSSPACVIFPKETTHVQTAMKAIYQNKVRYAVQAGGHSAMEGWNTVQDGILISFSEMRNVTYDPAADTISLQPGVRWVDAIAAVESHGVAPLGGRASDVGTGLLLGGGLSFLAPEYGFSADMFKTLDVVLVTGELVTATATNAYADLFRVLKGGANRFGIVTRYEVQAVHTGTKDEKRWFGGVITYPDSSAEALVNATADYVRTVEDSKAALLTVLVYAANGSTITTTHFAAVFYQGASLPPSVFSSFLSIPSTSQTLTPQSYSSMAAVVDAQGSPGSGQLFGATALTGPPEGYIDAFKHYRNLSMAILPSGKVLTSSLAFTPVPKSQILAGRKNGGNAIDPSLESYAAVALETQFLPGVTEVPEDVERARQLFFEQVPRSPGLPLYVNECDKQQNVFETYGAYDLLTETYEKYDPTRFNMQYTDGPMGL